MTAPLTGRPTADAAALLTALRSLEAAGVVYCLRNGPGGLTPSAGEDVDVLVEPVARRAAGRALAQSGWWRLRAPGHRGHQFWLCITDRGNWLKIDLVWQLRYGHRTESPGPWLARRTRRDGVWVAGRLDEQRHREHRAAGHRERPTRLERLARQLPARPGRAGPVVAVLGPDGAGKGLLITALTQRLPVAVTTAYLGRSRSGGTSPGPRRSDGAVADASAVADRQQQTVRLREVAFLLRKWLRTLKPFALAYRAAWKGHVVLLDRHPLDAVAVAPRRSRWGTRLERALATRLSPRPDALLVLDAPGDVLFARKGEHSPAVLELWRAGYRALAVDADVHVLDATCAADDVAAQAGAIVWSSLARRRRWGLP